MLDYCPSSSKVHKKVIDLFCLLSCSQLAFPVSNLFSRQNIFRFAFSHFKFIAIFAVTSSTLSCTFQYYLAQTINTPIPTTLSPFPRRGVIAVVFYFFFGIWILLAPQAAAALLAVTLMHQSNNHKKGFKEP